jgi:hypothetical protein
VKPVIEIEASDKSFLVLFLKKEHSFLSCSAHNWFHEIAVLAGSAGRLLAA